MNPISQTQSFVVKPLTNSKLPENLIAQIRIIKSTKTKANVLPRTAMLSDETQTKFWVMKLINDSIAVKISVKKGVEAKEMIEIIDPVFSESDRIILNGNFGLADTVKVDLKTKE